MVPLFSDIADAKVRARPNGGLWNDSDNDISQNVPGGSYGGEMNIAQFAQIGICTRCSTESWTVNAIFHSFVAEAQVAPQVGMCPKRFAYIT
jgi:hypothetical protein